MSQVKLLKIDTDGVPVEMNSTNDDITLKSFTTASGIVMNGTGINMNNLPISAISSASFQDPTTGTINQTASNLIINNIMGKDRDNVMTTASSVLFPLVTDTGATVDLFQLPRLAGAPTSTPANNANAGYEIYDTVNNKIWVWNGTAWVDTTFAGDAKAIDDNYVTSMITNANDAIYISASGTVGQADCSTQAKSMMIGFGVASATSGGALKVRKFGRLTGFTGLTAAARHFLSTTGLVSASVPSTTGYTIVQVGYALSATELDIQIQQLGRRA